jgi:P27 family predicted phage terminase small subunit
MQGRKPEPTTLGLVEGNRGKRPLNDKEAKPAKAIPRPPAHFRDEATRSDEGEAIAAEARAEYRRMSRKLSEQGLLTYINDARRALFCDAYARWVVASRGLQKHGLLVKGRRGVPSQSPYAAMVNEAFAQMVKLATELGMTPRSRARILADAAGGLFD